MQYSYDFRCNKKAFAQPENRARLVQLVLDQLQDRIIEDNKTINDFDILECRISIQVQGTEPFDPNPFSKK